MMKKILCLILSAVMLICFAACGDKDTPAKKERKRAAKGQDTTTGTSSDSDTEQVVLDTGILTPLNETYAKSNKAGTVYDPNVFIELLNKTNGKVKIACVGDSITYGTLASNPDKTSYPSMLQKELDARFAGRFEVKNYGHAGAYIADFDRSNAGSLRYCFTDEYSKLRKDRPDVVIMMLGINDIGYVSDDAACEELKAAYSDLIAKIKGIKSKPLVFVCTPIVRTTAYSSYLALEPLRNTVVAAANAQGVYVIDTYNITKEYFSSALYETDGLHPNDAGYKYLAGVISGGIVDGLTEYAEGAKTVTPKYVVYVDSTKGKYNSVGATPDKPTSSLARAVELCQGGGTIVVSGPITPATTGLNLVKVFIAPENYGRITVTSIDPYNGTDYRSTNNARIYMSAGMYLQGDYEFKNVTFDNIASALKIVCGYNNVMFGKGFSTTVSSGDNAVLIYGHDIVSKWQTDEVVSCKESCELVVDSGTFTYLRGGNYRAYSASQSKYGYGTVKSGVTVNITVNGGTFTREDGSTNFSGASGTLSSALGQNGLESGAVVNLNINGGTFKGSVFAVPRMNPYPASGLPTVAGAVNIVMNKGIVAGAGIVYQQTFSGCKNPTVTGTYSLTVNGGTFSGSSEKIISGEGCPNSVLTLGANAAYLEGWASIKGFGKINK